MYNFRGPSTHIHTVHYLSDIPLSENKHRFVNSSFMVQKWPQHYTITELQ